MSGLQAPGFAEQATSKLFPGVPRDCFVESRKNVTVERISEIVILVHDGRTVQASGFAEQATKGLFTGVKPIRSPVLHELPRDFFNENGKSITVERINENMIRSRS